jgi:LPPG:FO 2-phospho-L-lactate transferase
MASILPATALTIMVNTGDDFEHWGLHVSPDLDTVMYNLAGVANSETGWGLSGDTFEALDMISRYGGPGWFQLGDRDLATSLIRTMLLQEGNTLTEVTSTLAARLGTPYTILPMSDQPVRTILTTDQGDRDFQEYFVRDHWQPVVREIRYEGADQAHGGPQVLSAIEDATLIVFGPSNPYLSIDPILAVDGIRAHITSSRAPRVAVSPIIGGQAVKGPAAKIMGELGYEVSPFGVVKHYEELIKGIILDDIDQHLIDSIDALNIRAAARHILMETPADKTRLAGELLEWAEENFS